MLVGTPNPAELLAISGQSRLHLRLREMLGKNKSSYSPPGLQKQIDSIIDYGETAYPDFPGSLEEEAAVFRKHGLPLLVWPSGATAEELQEVRHFPYNTRNY
ncbi:unnamed protein product [Echinostoma caproni]|uniref:Glycosyl transferase n=1 Tax=Echinostoma caproni TaxID=27848 RepID=A0A183ASB1_9TREM|nr:unnamed protein product [Echinostoma caproni]